MNHTFVIMAYKDSIYIESCIHSLQKQTIPSILFIATSTPSEYILSIGTKYNIPVHITEPQRGIAHDWNFSFQLATTKYITLAHQDDIYEPEYVKKSLDAAQEYDDTLICFTDYKELINEYDRKTNLLMRIKIIILKSLMPFKKQLRNKLLKVALVAFGNPIACPSVMYNKEKLKNFQFSDFYKICLDWDAWLRIAKINGRFVYVPYPLVKHRIHENSETTSGLKTNSRQDEDYKIFSRIWPKPIAKIFSKLYSLSYKSNEEN